MFISFLKLSRNSRFAYDVTKIQTKELSILPSSYFHEVLQQLNPFVYANVQFERVLRFAMEAGLNSQLAQFA